ncbi:NADH-quinone oxidoreductase subunit NuoE [Clostridium grantii]|uniref:NADH-quinone oxidoreductase subunit E n=1 Tax=Clostridium grantii DSM 8605 TaxID=1121316 RepID=A0A1M5XCW7_9CLOT|nr:NADH-quinone oxidoreductase subunit NuoE [Clostridium grantii]SHH97695.1 NADH-quinone oxidoreductase subunit E [Clostridium grantii DSM 8605]
MKEKCCCSKEKDDRIEKIRTMVQSFKDVKGPLIPVMHEVQKMYGYLEEEALEVISEELKVPMAEIYGVATFYSQFSLEPKGDHTIKVCLGTACYVKGSQNILDKFSDLLNVEVGKTTEDGKFTLEAARCLGSCGLAPIIMVDDKVYGGLHPNDVIRILEEYK